MRVSADRKRLLEIRRTIDALAGDSERLHQLIVELLAQDERRAGYRIEPDPAWGDLAHAIRRARLMRGAERPPS